MIDVECCPSYIWVLDAANHKYTPYIKPETVPFLTTTLNLTPRPLIDATNHAHTHAMLCEPAIVEMHRCNLVMQK
jgi:hypothetical protein